MSEDVFQFEGDEVSDFTAQIPSVKLEAPAAYPRGTYLNLNLTVRVRSVRIEEDRKGGLTRHHILALDDCTITSVLTPQQRKEMMLAVEAEAMSPGGENVIQEEPAPGDLVHQATSWEDMTSEQQAEARRLAVAEDWPSDSDGQPNPQTDIVVGEPVREFVGVDF